jgi:hypothetical protein
MPSYAMWTRTAARFMMLLNKLEREVLTDSMLKVQSIQASLHQIDASKIPDIDEIHSCLRSADTCFRSALRDGSSSKKQIKR